MRRTLTNTIALFLLLLTMFTTSFALPTEDTVSFVYPQEAYADIHVGDTDIKTWGPNDIVETDIQVSDTTPQEATNKLSEVIVRGIKILMPLLMIACVVLIIYVAVRNLFCEKEKRTQMGPLIKNMVIQYFFILGAFVIVELIVFAVSAGETILFSTILG